MGYTDLLMKIYDAAMLNKDYRTALHTLQTIIKIEQIKSNQILDLNKLPDNILWEIISASSCE